MNLQEVAKDVALHDDGRSVMYIADKLSNSRSTIFKGYEGLEKLILTREDLGREDEKPQTQLSVDFFDF
ncbi:hypothetical protein HHI36_008757, partial [Cryptolaemus montrouzieri]